MPSLSELLPDLGAVTEGIDVHQHLLPDPLLDELRRRARPPHVRGSTLHLADRPPVRLDPRDYDMEARQELARRDRLGTVVISLSSPFGIEGLPPDEALPLLDAYHAAAAALPAPFAAWAGACVSEPDPGALREELRRGCVGLQLPATALAAPEGWDDLGGLLSVLEQEDRPLLVHPGPAADAGGARPSWWLPVVPFVGQLHAAWFAWHAVGRANHPRLRVCFVGLAGLAPLHAERLAARGGEPPAPDRGVFLETSSYGARAIEPVRAVAGPGAIVHGSDRPYAAPRPWTDEREREQTAVVNPRRLLLGEAAAPTR